MQNTEYDLLNHTQNTDTTEHTHAPKKRKNNPEQLRHTLICTARDIMITQGIHQLSMQKVADLAGTSKGGLFHHFKNKDELIHSVITLFIAQLNTAILALIGDNLERGSFTKAYAQVLLSDENIGIGSDWANLIKTINADAQLSQIWQEWLQQKLRQFASTDDDITLELVRCAVDGIWLNAQQHHNNQAQMLERLLQIAA